MASSRAWRLSGWLALVLGSTLLPSLLSDALWRGLAALHRPIARRLAGSLSDYNVVTPSPNRLALDKCFLVIDQGDWTFFDEQIQLIDTSLCPEKCCFAQRCASASRCAEDGGGGGGAIIGIAAVGALFVGAAGFKACKLCSYYRSVPNSLSSIEVFSAEVGDEKSRDFNGCYEASPGCEYFGQPIFQHDNGRMMAIYDKPNGGWKLRKAYALPAVPGRCAKKPPALDGVVFIPSGQGGDGRPEAPVGDWTSIATNKVGCSLRRLEPYTVTGADGQHECINGEYKRHSWLNSRPVWKNTRNECRIYFEKRWILFITDPIQAGDDGQPLKYQIPVEYRTSFFYESKGQSPDMPPEGDWKRHRQNTSASAETVTVMMVRPKKLSRWKLRGVKKVVKMDSNMNNQMAFMQNLGVEEPPDSLHFRAVLRTDLLLESFPKNRCVTPLELDQFACLREQLDNPVELLQNKPETFPIAVKLLMAFLDFYVKEGLKTWYLEEQAVDSNTILLMAKIDRYEDLSSWKEKIIKRRRAMALAQGTDWDSFRLERMTVTDKDDQFVDLKKVDAATVKSSQIPLTFKVQYGRQGPERVAGEPVYVTDAQRMKTAYDAARDRIRKNEAADVKATSGLVGNLTCRELLQFESDIDSEWDIANRLYQLYTQCGVLSDNYLAPLADTLKGEVAPLKGLVRVAEKMVMRPYEGLPWDVARMRVRCATMRQVNHTLQLMSEVQGMIVVRVNDRFARPRGGWCDICIYVVFDDPACCQVVGEIQIVHDALVSAAEETGMPDSYAADRFRAEVRKLKGKGDSAHLPWSVQSGEAETPGLADMLSREEIRAATEIDERAKDADSLDMAMLEPSKQENNSLAMESPVTEGEDAEFVDEVDHADMNSKPYAFLPDPSDLFQSVTLQIDDSCHEAVPFRFRASGPSSSSNARPAAKYPAKFEL